MIKHVVCFKLKDDCKERADEAVALLLSMNGKVPTAKTVAAHKDELLSPRSYDIILEVTLESFAALEEYQRDAYHAGTVKVFMHKITAASVAVDFTI